MGGGGNEYRRVNNGRGHSCTWHPGTDRCTCHSACQACPTERNGMRPMGMGAFREQGRVAGPSRPHWVPYACDAHAPHPTRGSSSHRSGSGRWSGSSQAAGRSSATPAPARPRPCSGTRQQRRRARQRRQPEGAGQETRGHTCRHPSLCVLQHTPTLRLKRHPLLLLCSNLASPALQSSRRLADEGSGLQKRGPEVGQAAGKLEACLGMQGEQECPTNAPCPANARLSRRTLVPLLLAFPVTLPRHPRGGHVDSNNERDPPSGRQGKGCRAPFAGCRMG